MSFLSHLESVISQVDGALACSVMGFDGISVETHQVATPEDVDLSTAWAEFAQILGQLSRAMETLQTGACTEVAINSDKLLTLVRMVSPEYFLVLAMRPEGNYGKGRYVLRVTAPKVKAEL